MARILEGVWEEQWEEQKTRNWCLETEVAGKVECTAAVVQHTSVQLACLQNDDDAALHQCGPSSSPSLPPLSSHSRS
jgi:hypothetical protein